MPENPEKRRERHRRYNVSEKGAARYRRYNNSDKGRKRHEDWYWSLSGVEYNLRLLRGRRQKGLARMEERNARRREEAI